MIDEFKKFALRGNVIDLAVGIIIGSAFTAIVSSLVNDIIMPPLGLLIGGVDFSDFFVVLKGSHYDSLAAAKAGGAVTINYGLFLNAILRFVIVAFAVFLLVRQVNRLVKTKEVVAAPTKTETLLGDILETLKAGQAAKEL